MNTKSCEAFVNGSFQFGIHKSKIAHKKHFAHTFSALNKMFSIGKIKSSNKTNNIQNVRWTMIGNGLTFDEKRMPIRVENDVYTCLTVSNVNVYLPFLACLQWNWAEHKSELQFTINMPNKCPTQPVCRVRSHTPYIGFILFYFIICLSCTERVQALIHVDVK